MKNLTSNNMKERFTVDTISHIVDKIKIRKTSYVLGLDFSGAFDHIPWLRPIALFPFKKPPDITSCL